MYEQQTRRSKRNLIFGKYDFPYLCVRKKNLIYIYFFFNSFNYFPIIFLSIQLSFYFLFLICNFKSKLKKKYMYKTFHRLLISCKCFFFFFFVWFKDNESWNCRIKIISIKLQSFLFLSYCRFCLQKRKDNTTIFLFSWKIIHFSLFIFFFNFDFW